MLDLKDSIEWGSNCKSNNLCQFTSASYIKSKTLYKNKLYNWKTQYIVYKDYNKIQINIDVNTVLLLGSKIWHSSSCKI